jgi:hypothetical protein
MEQIITCPNCNEFVIIEKLNCGIFRHGIWKETGTQIDPHLCKEECDLLSTKNLIYGCGKPFQIITENEVCKIQKCGYI